MKNAILVAVASLALAMSGETRAADPAPGAGAAATAPSQHAIDLAKRYFAVLHLDERMSSVMASLLPAMVDQFAGRLSDVTPDAKSAIVEATKGAMTEWFPLYMDQMAVEYARILTDDDLAAAVAFYESAPGRSMIAKEGTLAPAATKIMLDMQPRLNRMMLERLCRRLDCTKLKAPPADKPS